MALTAVTAGNRAITTDVNQIINLLKGVAASGENITLIYNAGALTLQPSSDPSAGTRVLTIKNNAGTTLFAARYDGLLEMLAAAAAPGTPVAGSVYWDTLLAALRVYDGTNWRDMAGGSTGPNPNAVLNSDFSRRTVFGLAMPEVFADLSGTTKIDGGAAGSVAANIFTQGAANNEYAWCAGSFVWRDGRASATFKAVSATGVYELRWRISATDWVMAYIDGVNLVIQKRIASSNTNVTVSAQALTLNRWYWLEIEKQNTTFIVKLYDTLGTVPGVVKASSTLLQTITGTVADASMAAGAHISILSDQAAAQWGGIATGNGGVYVETWLPESLSVSFLNTLGGQAIGYDESSDAGPISKQWALRAYIPATSRRIEVNSSLTSGFYVQQSTAYAQSCYVKTSGKAGAGAIASIAFGTRDAAGGTGATMTTLTDAGETSWTRKTGTATSAASARMGYIDIVFGDNSTTTGTAYLMCVQEEQGSAVTAWRNAPADDAGGAYDIALSLDKTTTSAAFVDLDSRDMAGNFFLPYDATVLITFYCNVINSAANTEQVAFSVDGVDTTTLGHYAGGATSGQIRAELSQLLAAGKHRIAVRWRTSAGTATMQGAGAAIGLFRVSWTRGK